jgi:hypothetical protein
MPHLHAAMLTGRNTPHLSAVCEYNMQRSVTMIPTNTQPGEVKQNYLVIGYPLLCI